MSESGGDGFLHHPASDAPPDWNKSEGQSKLPHRRCNESAAASGTEELEAGGGGGEEASQEVVIALQA